MKRCISYSLILLVLLSSCFEEEEEEKINPIYLIESNVLVDTILMDKGLPYNIIFIPSSRERVFVSTNTDGELVSSYSSTTRVEGIWKMWFVAFNKNLNDLDLSIFQLFSNDSGATFERLYTDNQYLAIGNGCVVPQNEGASDFCVFYDSNLSRYKMIFQKLYRKKNVLYSPNCIVESLDGIKWSEPIILDSQNSDTQPSIVQKNNKYYVYMRHKLNGNIRSITVRTLDAENNKQIGSTKLLPKSPFVGYPHLYNNAASKIDEIYTLFLPTIYSEETQECRIVWGYSSDNYNIKWGINNLSFIFVNMDVSKWFIVSPSLIPCDESGYFWIYYLTRNASHNQYLSTSSTEYWRIKVKVQTKNKIQ